MSNNLNRLESDFIRTLNSKAAFGQSRHEAKKDGSDVNKIFSYNTMNQYRRVALYFAKFCHEKNPKIQHVNQCKKYVNDFIQQAKEDGKSA